MRIKKLTFSLKYLLAIDIAIKRSGSTEMPVDYTFLVEINELMTVTKEAYGRRIKVF